MEKGILYWITGLSGAGKTTIGTRLYYELRKVCPKLIILDGDILKDLVGNSLGYSKEERLQRANCYSNLCKVLTDQGISVIICTIAMYDSVREWNRRHIERYLEVFLKVEEKVLVERDKKGLYSKQKAGKISGIAGIDVDVEFPKNPDLIIENDGTIDISECVKRIMECPVRKGDSFSRDMIYWNEYYKKNLAEIQEPSDFAKAILQYMEEEKSLMDLGCGNGRDSLYFLRHKLRVTGIDVSEEAIRKLNELRIENSCFVCDDFVSSKALYQVQYDYFYSRWTMHAISERQEDELLQNVSGSIKEGGMFFIEARGIRDDLYGKGEQIAKNAFIYNEHFRRFMDKEIFMDKLEKYGFSIMFAEEGKDFSKTENSNPVLVRIVAVKR